MKPKQPLPTERPFITFMTCTYRRPKALAENMKSIARQTLAKEIEQIIIPDYVGVSPNDAVYGRLPRYAENIHGQYVHVLGDDDVLADATVVEQIKQFVFKRDFPDGVIVKCKKGDQEYPKCGVAGEPVEGDVDLCCYVLRADVFRKTMRDYEPKRVCDWDYLQELTAWTGANGLVPLELLFAQGAVGSGRPEAVDW